MKPEKKVILFILVLIFSACQREVLTKPVKFTSTTYENLAPYDTSGKPGNLLPPDAISADLLSFIRSTLPERVDVRNTHPEFLNNKAIADIAITAPSNVYITFIAQGTGYSNALAFYTYPTGQSPASPKDIKTITYIFPNVGYGTPLKAGDKVKIGRFNAGTSIGFVLLKDAWNSKTKTLNNGAVHFCSNDVLNPEVDPNLKKHAVLIPYPKENKVLIGFEDIDRTSPYCDHDFNDVVTYATITP